MIIIISVDVENSEDQKEKNNNENSRLILISNGEPYQHKYDNGQIICEKLPGGLTTGLDPMMQEEKGVWIAWGRGEADFKVVDNNNEIKVPDDNGYTLKRIQLNDREKNGFYYGFSNETLWPISHSFISKANFNLEHWQIYREVNEKYAEAAREEITDDDYIWIHDYHLTLTPRMIKNKNREAKIAFFWHIPWPSWEAFACIPWRNQILKGLLASDFIGFHTSELVTNFLNCARRIGAEIDWEHNIIKYDGHRTKAAAVPLGVDYKRFSNATDEIPEINLEKQIKNIKDTYYAEYLIFGVDRLDYTKGIPQRLQAVDMFFKKYPQYRGKVTLVQRVSPSRSDVEEYQNMQENINRMIGDINGRYQKDEWEPIKYFLESVPQDELLAYYRAADIALITPLIDGMNLVAKEYVATSHNGGSIILSEFAGAAEELNEALLVNPYHTEEVAETIDRALQMPEPEKKRRFNKLKEKVKKHDINWWREKFLEEWFKLYD